MPDAQAASWKHLPAPKKRTALPFDAVYTAEQYARLRQGRVPQEMEDKWFIYLEDSVLRFHRSWTGIWIYAVTLQPQGEQWHASNAWVNRETDQYGCTDLETDRKLLLRLVDNLLAAPVA